MVKFRENSLMKWCFDAAVIIKWLWKSLITAYDESVMMCKYTVKSGDSGQEGDSGHREKLKIK